MAKVVSPRFAGFDETNLSSSIAVPMPKGVLSADYLHYSNRLEAFGSPYFGAVDAESGARILRPASVYCPKRRTVAIASKETGTHIPFTSAYCRVI